MGLPQGSPAGRLEGLYLGRADYLLWTDKHPLRPDQEILWAETAELRRVLPELELVAELTATGNQTYGQRARLFRFRPDPEHFRLLQQRYPWAGTHPRSTCDQGTYLKY